MGDERDEIRRELREAQQMVDEGRHGASAEWLAAAESYVRLLQDRYAASGDDQEPPAAGAPAPTAPLPPPGPAGRD
jgi:hypothetical protein